jgi:hypothetical protein
MNMLWGHLRRTLQVGHHAVSADEVMMKREKKSARRLDGVCMRESFVALSGHAGIWT